MKQTFGGNIIMLGCGSVGSCTLPLLLKHLDVPAKHYTVIDFVDNRHLIQEALAQGVHYVQERITREQLTTQLKKYLRPGDLLIDLSWYIDCAELLQWCYDNNVLYINTSVEIWESEDNDITIPPTQRTLYYRHTNLRKKVATWTNPKSATAVLDHGANPGLVSHFTKQGLLEIATRLIQEPNIAADKAKLLDKAIADEDFAKLGYLTQTQVIHISERDTQLINKPKKPGEFVNTWSIDGLYEEAIAPAEMGWGTHEKTLPQYAYTHEEGPQHQICLGKMGMHTWVRSWVPSGEIVGMVIRHGEAFTIPEYLSVYENGKAIYRPTVHYAYCPSDMAINSLHELAMRNYVMQPQLRIARDEIISGCDELGVLLMGHPYNSWWVGSTLHIDEARSLVPQQNATTLQVAASVMSAVVWMIKNPQRGLNIPDHLPHREILNLAKPYLGKFQSFDVNWTPLKNREQHFVGYSERVIKPADVWQFEAFLHA